jgi:hypothetical protein
LAAYRLALPRTGWRPEYATKGQSSPLVQAHEFLADELKSGDKSGAGFIDSLPPVVLHLLTSIPYGRLGRDLKPSIANWKRTLKVQLEADDNDVKGIPVVAAARIVAHHILHGMGKPISTVRLTKSLFGQQWIYVERKTTVLDAVEAGVAILRSPWSDTAARLKAVQNIARGIEEDIRNWNVILQWRHIENALYHQLFCWPLLVFSSGTGAISLPVGIDVYLDGKAKAAPDPVSGGEIDVRGWEQPLSDIVEAAKVQWRGKHGNYGPLRDEISTASVVFDFQTANKIASGFPEAITLKDSSMEAYFSQVVLSRFLGNTVSSSSVVTGSIGKRRSNEPGGFADYEFIWPGGVKDKLKYVFQSEFFERVILPDLDPEDFRRRDLDKSVKASKSEQSTEINFVTHLQHVADAFQIGGWRQCRYVRCPDIGWRIHPFGTRLPSLEDDGVQECIKAIRANESTVWELPAHLGVVNLASALWHSNMTLRNQIQYDRPPMMSWAFVRAIANEQDARFWHVVWTQLGASSRDFAKFHETSTTGDAAHRLAEALNVFSPSQTCPSHRAPDILVLVGTKHLSASLEKAKNPLLRCQAFDPVLQVLRQEGVLQPNCFGAMRELVGQTRIIVIRSDEFLGEEQPQDALEPELETLLSALRVFRFGFTQQMASVAWNTLGRESVPVRDLLQHFVERGLLRYGLGEYHVPGKVGVSSVSSSDPTERARIHYAAGVAMAPYLSLTNMPSLAFDRAFRPEIVHEAHFHLRESYGALEKKEREPFRQAVGAALQRIQRFGEYPGWSAVNNLLKSKTAAKDAYEIAMDLLDAREETGTPPHPVQLLTAIRAVEQRWDEMRKDPDPVHKDEVDNLRRTIDDLFDQGRAACARKEWLSERDYNLLSVVSQRATFLYGHRQILLDGDIGQRVEALSGEAWNLLAAGTDGSAARGGWYEIEGDRRSADEEAELVYGQGVQWSPGWRSLWFKHIGCLSRLGKSEAINGALATLTPELIEAILKSGIGGLRRDHKRPSGVWMKLRWQSGITEFKNRFSGDPALRGLIKLYLNELSSWK